LSGAGAQRIRIDEHLRLHERERRERGAVFEERGEVFRLLLGRAPAHDRIDHADRRKPGGGEPHVAIGQRFRDQRARDRCALVADTAERFRNRVLQETELADACERIVRRFGGCGSSARRGTEMLFGHTQRGVANHPLLFGEIQIEHLARLGGWEMLRLGELGERLEALLRGVAEDYAVFDGVVGHRLRLFAQPEAIDDFRPRQPIQDGQRPTHRAHLLCSPSTAAAPEARLSFFLPLRGLKRLFLAMRNSSSR
jgi:hypothetical protein